MGLAELAAGSAARHIGDQKPEAAVKRAFVADHGLGKIHQGLEDRRPVCKQQIAVGNIAIRLLDHVEASLEFLWEFASVGKLKTGHGSSLPLEGVVSQSIYRTAAIYAARPSCNID